MKAHQTILFFFVIILCIALQPSYMHGMMMDCLGGLRRGSIPYPPIDDASKSKDTWLTQQGITLATEPKEDTPLTADTVRTAVPFFENLKNATDEQKSSLARALQKFPYTHHNYKLYRLLVAGALHCNAHNAEMQTQALGHACGKNDQELIALLLQHKTDPNAGLFPSLSTVTNPTCAQLLLEAGAAFPSPDDLGNTFIHTALSVCKGRSAAFLALLAVWARKKYPASDLINQPNKAGDAPLHFLSTDDAHTINHEELTAQARVLIEHGADMKQMNKVGTPFEFALSKLCEKEQQVIKCRTSQDFSDKMMLDTYTRRRNTLQKLVEFLYAARFGSNMTIKLTPITEDVAEDQQAV